MPTKLKYNISPLKRGISKTPEYRAWYAMIARCYDTRSCIYKYYGGRGITVCAEWRTSFMAFFEYMGERPTPKHSLDRINNDGNYEPDNCRWATWAEQASNRRHCRYKGLVEYNGERRGIAEWARIVGMRPATLATRLRHGWSIHNALIIPVSPSNRSNTRHHNEFTKP